MPKAGIPTRWTILKAAAAATAVPAAAAAEQYVCFGFIENLFREGQRHGKPFTNDAAVF